MSMFKDLSNTLERHELLMTLCTEDIRQRYRRSILGPFWNFKHGYSSFNAWNTIWETV